MKTDKVPITLRLDSKTHEALKLISTHEMRSLNTQIEYFLRNAVLAYNSDIVQIQNAIDSIICVDQDLN